MRLLILGGTVFVGRHLIDAARERGHEVTIFNRGRHAAEIPSDVERLKGDRYENELEALRGRRWDTVVDTSGFAPHIVGASASLLADAVEHYTFISSGSVYRDTSVPGVDEDYPVGTLTEEQLREAENIRPQTDMPAKAYGWMYGPLKALCERAAEQRMPWRVLNARAGLIVGPFDYSDRFTYWPSRIASAHGGDVLAPGRPSRQIQFVDARDLADWIVRMAEARGVGVYNATGPDYVLTMERFLEECLSATGSEARVVWVEERFLLDAGVKAWSELPLWLPEEDNVNRYFLSVNCDKAIKAGLRFRPLAETIRDTLSWDTTRPSSLPRLAGLERERELQLLREWRGRG